MGGGRDSAVGVTSVTVGGVILVEGKRGFREGMGLWYRLMENSRGP